LIDVANSKPANRSTEYILVRDEDKASAGTQAERYPASKLWPNWQQSLLLTAAMGEDAEAAEAFCRWRESIDLEADFDPGSYRLMPLVYDRMRRLNVRDPVMGRLKGVYRMSWYGNQVLFDKVRSIVSALEERGITPLLLAGVPLALYYYRNPAVRPVGAIDIAVSPRQVRGSIAVIEASGWQRNAIPSAEDLRYRHCIQFTDLHGHALDLHWHFLYEACNDEADAFFWSSAIPLDFGGEPTLQLDPTAMLVYVILRGIRWDADPPHQWIADALLILRYEGGRLDWERIIAFAQGQRLTYRLSLGLGYLAERHNAPLPRAVLTRLRQIGTSLLERIENTVDLHHRHRFYTNPFGKQWVIFVDFCRCTTAAGPIEFFVGLSHYIRYRWGLERRRDLIVVIPRGLMRRIGNVRLSR
jgi:hypothetical protein